MQNIPRSLHQSIPSAKSSSATEKRTKNYKRWILQWFEHAIDRKKRMFHFFVKAPTTENKFIYKKLENTCDKHVDIAKENYYKKLFDSHKDSSKQQLNPNDQIVF